MSNPDFTLKILNRDTVFKNCFKSVSILQSMESMAGTFSATTTNFFPDKIKKWNIKLGDKYSIKIDDKTIGTGYIDEIDIIDDPNSDSITFKGRDVTADLVDCSYDGSNNEWNSLTLFSLVTILCDPFNIKVSYDNIVATEVFKLISNFTNDQGMTVHELIMKECLKKGVIPLSYGDGKLTLTRATNTLNAKDIISTTNILSRNISYSNRDRYQTYSVKGQRKDSDSNTNITDDKESAGKYKDKTIRRHRPYIILLESAGDSDACKKRAAYEANTRAGQSRSVEYIVEGWIQIKGGQPWQINSLVTVDDPLFGIKDRMIISEIEFIADADSGFRTVLKLVHKNTYSLKEVAGLIDCGFDVDTVFGSINAGDVEGQTFW